MNKQKETKEKYCRVLLEMNNSNSKKSNFSEKQSNNNNTKSKKNFHPANKVWWKNFKSDICCPITLTPINLLQNAPFEIVDSSSKGNIIKCVLNFF